MEGEGMRVSKGIILLVWLAKKERGKGKKGCVTNFVWLKSVKENYSFLLFL